jgi:hypothetical protein
VSRLRQHAGAGLQGRRLSRGRDLGRQRRVAVGGQVAAEGAEEAEGLPLALDGVRAGATGDPPVAPEAAHPRHPRPPSPPIAEQVSLHSRPHFVRLVHRQRLADVVEQPARALQVAVGDHADVVRAPPLRLPAGTTSAAAGSAANSHSSRVPKCGNGRSRRLTRAGLARSDEVGPASPGPPAECAGLVQQQMRGCAAWQASVGAGSRRWRGPDLVRPAPGQTPRTKLIRQLPLSRGISPRSAAPVPATALGPSR